MPIQLIGGPGDVPFNRTFFNVKLGDLLQQTKEKSHKLTLFLADGSTLDVCHIDELQDSYLAVRAYQGQNDHCELAVHLLPYGLIYRIEISPKTTSTSGRVGFSWTTPSRKTAGTGRRSKGG